MKDNQQTKQNYKTVPQENSNRRIAWKRLIPELRGDRSLYRPELSSVPQIIHVLPRYNLNTQIIPLHPNHSKNFQHSTPP